MADRIEINFTANTRDVARGAKEMQGDLSDTEKSLDDLGDTGEKSLEKVTDGQKDVAKGASDLAGTVGGELSSSFQKFDGTAGGAIDAVGSGLAGLTGLIPGVGAALGVIASEGIGAITRGLKDAQEEADKAQARITAAFTQAASDGRDFLDEQQIIAAATDIINDSAARATAQQQARDIGVSAATFIRAMAGDQAALNEVIAAGAAAERDAKDAVGDTLTLKRGPVQQADAGHLAAVQAVNEKLETQRQLMQEGVAAGQLAVAVAGEDHELIQKQNKALAETPRAIPVKVSLDDSDIDAKLNRSRAINVTVNGYDRLGNRII